MSVRAFKYFTIGATNTAQPLIGTTLSTAVPAPILFSPDALTTLTVVDSSMILAGDPVDLDSTAAASEERVYVFKVVDATHIQVKGMQFAHANGAFVRLGAMANDIYIQPKDGNTQSLFAGTSSASKIDGTLAIKQLVKVAAASQANDFYINRGTGSGNPEALSQYWIVGTNPDQYLASFWQQ